MEQETKFVKKDITTFEEAVDYLNDTPRFTTKNEMQDTRAFLERLGNPDRKMKIIHVAGTNGKGSVCAYLRSILEAAGYSVALFTSPHLVDIRERFVVKGEMVSEEDFFRAFRTVYDRIDWESGAYHPTYFEFLFFIAMILFPEQNPDFCILETGLGGRLDATNAVAKKELSVITHISLDHVEYLGDTVEQIAAEKAGIMQANSPVVCWETSPAVNEVFSRQAKNLGIFAYFVSKNDYTLRNFKGKSIDFSVSSSYYNYISLTLHTIAEYQMENAALAVRAIEVLDKGKTITKEQIQKGIATCRWAGRMEEVLPEVYVDGAHNEDGIRAFLETVSGDGHRGTRGLLFSAVKDKDYEHMIERLVRSGLFDRIAVVQMSTGRATSLERLEKMFSEYNDCAVEVHTSVASAFEKMVKERREDERIYVAGSLYLVGEIKELLL